MGVDGSKYGNRRPQMPHAAPSWVEGYEPRPLTLAGGIPAPGCYVLRLVRGGVPVAARIWVEDGERDPVTGDLLSDQRLLCEVDGRGIEDISAEDPRGWPWWPISEQQHSYMTADAAWLRRHDPSNPRVNPTRRLEMADAPVF